MVQAYNFLSSWQLFPEKCNYEFGVVPKSGNYKIESVQNGHALSFSINWVSITNDAFYTQYTVIPNNEVQVFDNQEIADSIKADIVNAGTLIVWMYKNEQEILKVVHEILANGYLKVSHWGNNNGQPFVNVEVYHKQISVLPYASSITGVAIKPTKEGVIKHKALTAMEEQTNMQLEQIKQQIELLAKQAQEINKRKELSLMIYEATLRFKPQIGHIYHLYEKKDGSYILSLVAPKEWGASSPFKQFIATVKLLADHTWTEVA